MALLLLSAAMAAPTRPALLKTFSATSWSHNYASGSFNQTTVRSPPDPHAP